MIENHPLYAEQIELEAQMISAGMTAYFHAEQKAATAGRAADNGAASFMATIGIEPVQKGIEEFFAFAGAGRRGPKGAAYNYLKGMPTDVVAAVTVKTVINWLSRPNRPSPVLVSVAHAVGEAIEAEAMVLAYQKDNPKLVKAILAKLDKTTSHAAHRRRVILASMRKNDFNPPRWDKKTCILVGVKLVEIMLEVSGLIEAEVVRQGKEYAHVVHFTASAAAAMADRRSHLSKTMPALGPCIIPPKPWDSRGRDGGYWSPVTIRPLRLIKGKGGYGELVPGAIVEAVNKLQETAWKVNPRVLSVLQDVVYKSLDHLGVLPPVADVPIPPKPEDIDTNLPAREVYRAEAARAYGENAARKSKRIMVYRALGVAEQYAKYEAIYFPHNLDFRGRVYPIPQWLNPQGPDFVKGLLYFAEGKPIGDDQGPGWLAIHGANSFGVDKVSLEERIDWVEQHREDIRSVASDPLQCMWWTEADSPWCFLAFCFEWRDYLDAVDAGRGGDFVSNLPVMVDGSCNGIQHFSAMLRDPVGGKATNLIPGDKPSDIYGSVANATIVRLRAECSKVEAVLRFGKDEEERTLSIADVAAKWIEFGIDRKITKRSVMVLPYGGTFKSCRDYVQEAVRDTGRATAWAGDADAERAAISYLAKVVWESIGDVVVGARDAKAWLQQLVRIVMKAGKDTVWWRTPTGLKTTQRYWELDHGRIETAFLGKVKFRVRTTDDSDRPDKHGQVNGFSPNFVHSLDASALIETILLATDHGVTGFAAVHDSFGTHAADMGILSACIRHAFVSLYEEHDVLDNLYTDILSQLPDGTEVPEPPPKGSLDIKEVMNSDFFFA